MNNTLYLTADEQKLFDSLSDDLKEGWKTEEETLVFEDTQEKQSIRLALMHLQDPRLKELQQKVQAVTSGEQLLSLIEGVDLGDINEADLAELFFSLGPSFMNVFITYLFKHVSTDDDIGTLSALSTLRHALLESMVTSS